VTLRRLPRPTPASTPIQQACWHLGEAFRAARTDRRTFEAFVSIIIERTARESLRLLEHDRRRRS
jgi:hypothetical protein